MIVLALLIYSGSQRNQQEQVVDQPITQPAQEPKPEIKLEAAPPLEKPVIPVVPEPKPEAKPDPIPVPLAEPTPRPIEDEPRGLTLFSMGKGSESTGHVKGAIGYYRDVIDQFPGSPAAKKAAERIKALEKPSTKP